MSAQPHIVLSWLVRRTRLPLLHRRCPDCRSASATTGPGRFRVNANGKLLDVWLLVRCVGCDRTSKLTVHERVPVARLDPAALDGYHANDPALVAAVLLDPRHRAALDWRGAWRLDTPAAPLAGDWPVQVEVEFADPVPVRPDRLIAHGLGISRNDVPARVKCDVSLRRPATAGFRFVVLSPSAPPAAA
ncbi:DUF1062 domain-containing protein [Dactylosporangium vinaceum]|uniref:DUF1062 domain-containing protein n=1 Tax=Dactylosporangium vinaceum TaxID=53362 RepID=A0ABV5MBZ3_9ACTN|nr:DUF1062 domain-containing protein [Dactylosporangium vinaceum]UAC01331.1 DUF1062 domain-containing protein [Dactylosporangium vinaceum]